MKVNNNLVCIANIETSEVLRIPAQEAQKEFTSKSKTKWYYTTKRIYKQYVDSLKPGNNIPKPIFVKEIENENGKMITTLQNVFVGEPSYRINKKKSSCNKKGKYRFQQIKANRIFVKYSKPKKIEKNGKIVEELGEWIEKEARTIKHLK